MPAPEIIHQLVAKFTENREAYRSGKYNEARLRQEFLDPFFAALGWDVYNAKGVAPQYADVIIEESLDIEGGSKSPDYTFKVGPERKFFVEAKKPKVDIKYDIHPAFQLRRYAWNAQLPLSILTDFEEFAVYNCKAKPDPSDSAATARDLFFKYTEYAERWDEIAAIFSRDAVWKGALDRYAEGSKGKKGTTAVDAEFLKDMNEWRVALARNIALRNDHVKDEQQLNYAVQMTIDRVIFLRICEDRGIEPEEQLKTLASAPNIYPRLLELFQRADVRYNSGLFHFNHEKGGGTAPDTFTPSLKIDDRVLKDIIKDIYYPCPYIFKEIPVEILGQVYEQFLGQVIRLTPGHQAKVEEKPEVRKAGGVYYTPRYIVDYIVENTVGKLLEGKTPEQVIALKIVDPACGSGSFLLGAFQYLIDWHEQWYLANDPAKWTRGKAPALNEVTGGYRLTTLKKKEILLNNIHGVDIDPQAVEVTKLSLLLKVLEEETGQLSLGLERALPDLGRNIQCGNSLIGEDYFAGQLVVDPAERQRVNPFDWHTAFPQVFAQGGFDAVIGNPPYVRQESLGDDKKYFQTHYEVYAGTADLYAYFIEKGVSLLAYSGQFSYIVANKWLRANYGESLRKWLKSKCIEEIIDFGDLPVFEGAITYPCILRIAKEQPHNAPKITLVKSLRFKNLHEYVISNSDTLDQEKFKDYGWNLAKSNVIDLLEKIDHISIPLGAYVNNQIYRGILTGLNDAFIINKDEKEKILAYDNKSEELIKPFITGKEIKRYQAPDIKQFLIFIPKGWTRENVGKSQNHWKWLLENYPGIANHLEPYSQDAIKRWDKGDFWWELRACDYYSEFQKPKFIFPDISLRGNYIFDETGIFYSVNTTYIIPSKDLFLLGLLNSRLFTFYYSNVSTAYRGGYFRYIFQYVTKLPVYKITANDSKTLLAIDSLVTRMLDLHKQNPSTPQEHEQLRREIESTDRQIDQLVYQLYGLTVDEIALVESS